MSIHHLVFLIFISHYKLVLARQSCYWPNGSEANDTVSCNKSEDSVCCLPGDVCLSNNLCFGPGPGAVRQFHFSPNLEQHISY